MDFADFEIFAPGSLSDSEQPFPVVPEPSDGALVAVQALIPEEVARKAAAVPLPAAPAGGGVAGA